MQRHTKHIIILCFLLLTLNAFSKDVIVSKDNEINSVKKALAVSENGDRIIVRHGYYRENDIVVDKSVEIYGEDFPVIDLEYNYQGFTVKAGNVSIFGLDIRNIATNYMHDFSGIKIENSNYCTVENNRLYNNFFAVYLAGSDYCTVKNNIITGFAKTESSSGNGIHLWKCKNILIENNETSGHRDGIYFEFVMNTKIINNFSHNNLRYGLHFMFSDSNSYLKNLFRDNGAGVAVMYTKNIEMSENRFEDNWGPSSYGILLKEISNSVIRRNLFVRNTTGIFMEGSDKLMIKENEFRENGFAVKILGNCINDTLLNNNFTANTFDISSNSSRNDNYYSGNYWDKYSGYDLNNDNTGDIPYRPVSLYSIMIEKVPESIIMLKSLITEILDLTEKAMPVFIPESLSDESPRMKMNEYD
ncbi:MAG: nitrous oxide reductase family maturation protein NosD [Ignavibacteria bacterium]|nr:nitrous oxide reductase family maturation protein NosD [Ignavibacteria bacterium]